MPQTDALALENVLNSFINIKEKEEIAKLLSELTKIEAYQIIPDCLQTLSDEEERDKLSDHMMQLIISYLQYKQSDPSNNEIIFNVFSTTSLRQLGILLLATQDEDPDNQMINQMIIEKKMMLMDELYLHKLSDELFTIATKKLGEDILKWRNVLGKMRYLKIDAASLTDYEVILNLPLAWFVDSNEKVEKLNKKLFTPNGLKSALQYIKPNDLNNNDIEIINRLVEKLILHTNLPDWEIIHKIFIHSTSEFKKLFVRYTHIFNISDALALNMTPFIQEPDLILLLEDTYFEKDNISKTLLLFSINANSAAKNSIIKKLRPFHFEIDKDYVQLLNSILEKFEYKMLICDLTKTWLSKQGLQKLNKFSNKYLTPSGILLINKFPGDIEDELIEEINECEDHTSLITYLNTQLKPHANIADVAKARAIRIRKIDDAIQQLKSATLLGHTPLLDRKKANADAMMAIECPFSFELPISNQDQDAIIYINKNSQPIDYSKLNEKLMLIQLSTNDHDIIETKEHSYIGIHYPSLNNGDCFITANDILPFNDSTIDLDYLNQRLGLASPLKPISTTEDQIIWLTELKSNHYLDRIPIIFFTNKHLALLFKLNSHYFSNRDTACYLQEIVGSSIDDALITKLNYLLSYGKFLKISSELFFKAPLEWFTKKDVIEAIYDLAPNQISDLISNGPYQFALQSIQNAIFIFKYSITSTINDTESINLLHIHQNHPEYHLLLHVMEDHLSTENIKQLLFKQENQPLYRWIYRIYYLHPHQLSHAGFYQILKSKIKQDFIIQESYSNMIAEKLAGAYDHEYSLLKEKLKNYAQTHFNRDQRGEFTTRWPFSNKDQLKTYQAIDKAISNRYYFAKLNATIEEYRDVIESNDHFFTSTSSLFDIINPFIERVKAIFKTYRDIYRPYEKAFLTACLLDDDFHPFVTDPSKLYLYKRHRDIYFNILEIYRPAILLEVICYEPIQELYDAFTNQKKAKKETPATQPVVKNKTTRRIPQRIECKRDYQLQDPDIHVGIMLLRNDLKAQHILDDIIHHRLPNQSPHFTIQPKPPAHHHIIFIPFGNIVQNEKNKACNVIDMICETSVGNPESLCVGIFNVNTNHNILILLYTPQHSSTQILIIDPAYSSLDKTNTLSRIKDIFNTKLANKCIYIDINIIQQFNDSDCGIACLQNIYDIIQYGAITVMNNQLTIQRDKFKLDAYRYINNEQDFVLLAQVVRREWQEKLASQNACYIHDNGNDVFIGLYSFEKNKALQTLSDGLEDLVSHIISSCRESYGRDIYAYFKDHPAIPVVIPEELAERVRLYIKQDASCQQYFETLKQINDITATYPSEKINFTEGTLENNLVKQIQHIYCDKQYEILDEQFIDFIDDKNRHRYTTHEPLQNLYEEFVTSDNNIFELIQFFSIHNHDYFEHVKPKAERHLNRHDSSQWARLFSPITNPMLTEENQPVLFSSATQDSFKNNLVKNMGAILSTFKTCDPPNPSIWWYFSNRNLTHIMESCIAWQHWLERESSIEKLKSQRLYIGKKLMGITSYSSPDPDEACNLLKAPLARFLGIPEEQIALYNTSKKFERIDKQPRYFYDDFSILELSGYDYLQKLIKEKIDHLYLYGTLPYDYTQQYEQQYNYQVSLP